MIAGLFVDICGPVKAAEVLASAELPVSLAAAIAADMSGLSDQVVSRTIRLLAANGVGTCSPEVGRALLQAYLWARTGAVPVAAELAVVAATDQVSRTVVPRFLAEAPLPAAWAADLARSPRWAEAIVANRRVPTGIRVDALLTALRRAVSEDPQLAGPEITKVLRAAWDAPVPVDGPDQAGRSVLAAALQRASAQEPAELAWELVWPALAVLVAINSGAYLRESAGDQSAVRHLAGATSLPDAGLAAVGLVTVTTGSATNGFLQGVSVSGAAQASRAGVGALPLRALACWLTEPGAGRLTVAAVVGAFHHDDGSALPVLAATIEVLRVMRWDAADAELLHRWREVVGFPETDVDVAGQSWGMTLGRRTADGAIGRLLSGALGEDPVRWGVFASLTSGAGPSVGEEPPTLADLLAEVSATCD